MYNKIIAKLKSRGFEDHSFPISRRELLRLGLISSSGYLLSPLVSPVNAQSQSLIPQSMIPFLTFDLAGGAAMAGNFLTSQSGGINTYLNELCDDYKSHGWNPRGSNALDFSFGLPMASQPIVNANNTTYTSKMLQGMKQRIPQEYWGSATEFNQGGNLKLASFAHFSQDDTSGNRSSALTYISRAGLIGSKTKTGLGNANSSSGGNSSSALDDSRLKPTAIFSINNILELTSLGSGLDALSESDRKEILASILEQNKFQGNLAKFNEIYQKTFSNGTPHLEGDPRKNAEIAPIYNIANANENSATVVQAAIVYNVLMGYSGPGVISIGGCDYHDRSQVTGDRKDLEIGIAIGNAVRMAALLKKPLMFQIITDGSVYAPSSANFERVWVGDSNVRSLSILGYFNPVKKPELRQIQLGSYTKFGVVDQETEMGKGPGQMITSVLANYLSANNQLGKLGSILGRDLTSDELDRLLIFA
jgi:hypothetical protein